MFDHDKPGGLIWTGDRKSIALQLERQRRRIEELQAQSVNVPTLADITVDLGNVTVDSLTVKALESFDLDILFKTEDDVTIGQLDAGWIDSDVSGLGIYAIAMSAAELGYLAFVAYNDDLTKQNNIQMYSTGVTHFQNYQGSDVGNNTQYVDIATNSDQTNIIQTPFRIGVVTTGTAAAGFGTGLSMFAENGSGISGEIGALRFAYKDVTAAHEISEPYIGVIQDGTVVNFDIIRGFVGSAVSVANDATETDIISTTVKADSMGTMGNIEGDSWMLCFNNSGSDKTFTHEYNFGSFTYSVSHVMASNATNRIISMLRSRTVNDQASNAQVHIIDYRRYAAGALGANVNIGTNTAYANTSAVDTTAEITVNHTGDVSAANASENWKAQGNLKGPYYG